MAKTNYSFEKRQRELAKKKKQEEKRQRKVGRTESTGAPPAEGTDAAAPAPTTEPGKTP